MRGPLLDVCRFDWSNISPAIFGALFQSVMDLKERRAQGAHYTTEKNILKVIEPLFMDDLRAEFARLLGPDPPDQPLYRTGLISGQTTRQSQLISVQNAQQTLVVNPVFTSFV